MESEIVVFSIFKSLTKVTGSILKMNQEVSCCFSFLSL